MKNFAAQLLDNFDIDGGAVRVGAIRYSGVDYFGINSVFHLGEIPTKAQMQQELRNMPYAKGLTATGM